MGTLCFIMYCVMYHGGGDTNVSFVIFNNILCFSSGNIRIGESSVTV